MSADLSTRAKGRWLVVIATIFVLMGYLWLLALNMPAAVERQAESGTVTVDDTELLEREGSPDAGQQPEGSSPGIVALRFSVLLGIPLLTLIGALITSSRTAAVVARVMAAVVYGGLGLLTMFSAGPFFLTAAGLLLASAVVGTSSTMRS